MRRLIKSFLNKQRTEAQIRREAEIRSRIYLQEKGGKIWMICGDTAITVCDGQSTVTAKEMVEQLERCREHAVMYSKL